jgi:hypothetical protein
MEGAQKTKKLKVAQAGARMVEIDKKYFVWGTWA